MLLLGFEIARAREAKGRSWSRCIVIEASADAVKMMEKEK